MKATVLGGKGFIGRHLVAYLQTKGYDCWIPARNEPELYDRELGTIYYCIGLTADFRERPFETVEAHVGVLKNILERASFNKLIYLSSTRVYSKCGKANEDDEIKVASFDNDQLYNISKLMGESLALGSGKVCHVARISNVLGPDMGESDFIGAVLAEIKKTGSVTFRTAPNSSKDYIWVDDVVSGLVAISERGNEDIYNVAGGKNVCHEEIMVMLEENGIQADIIEGAPTIIFPDVDIERLRNETGWLPSPIHSKLNEMIKQAVES